MPRHPIRVLPGLLLLASLAAPPVSAQAPTPVAVTTPASNPRSFDCLLEARTVVKLGAEVTGVVDRVLVDRGDLVEAGQLVATLRADVPEAVVALAGLRASNPFQVQSQQSRRDYLRRKMERVQALQRKDVASAAAFDEVQSEFRMAENAEQEARLQQQLARLELDRETRALAQRQIRSPVGGVVLERALSAGEYRNESNHLLTIAQIDPLNVEVYLPIALYGTVRVGTLGSVVPEAPIGGRYDAQVTVVDRVADAASATFGVRLTLPNPGHFLPAGIRCRVTFAP
jgi:RND family efflux transporter MFP subunit